MMGGVEVPDGNAPPNELDVVRVRRALPEHGIAAGATGTVLLVHDAAGRPRAYEVEFSDSDGVTLAMVVLEQSDIEVTWRHRR
jgi:hypothetical protein